jgi:hypothetical protein
VRRAKYNELGALARAPGCRAIWHLECMACRMMSIGCIGLHAEPLATWADDGLITHLPGAHAVRHNSGLAASTARFRNIHLFI